jgi:hypothetical protein
MFSSLFPGKANTLGASTTRRNSEARASAAMLRARSNALREVGRAGFHSKVANVLRPDEGLHNSAAIRYQELAVQYFDELEAAITSITPEQRTIISRVRSALQSETAQAVQSGAREVAIVIPLFIANLIVILLNILLLAVRVGGFILMIGLFLSGAGMSDSPGIASIQLLGGFAIAETLFGSHGENARANTRRNNRGANEPHFEPAGGGTYNNNPNGPPPANYVPKRNNNTRRNRVNAMTANA